MMRIGTTIIASMVIYRDIHVTFATVACKDPSLTFFSIDCPELEFSMDTWIDSKYSQQKN